MREIWREAAEKQPRRAATRIHGMSRFIAIFALGLAAALGDTPDPDAVVRAALAAEARLDSAAALALFEQAAAARPNDAFILQKIARQYSDLVVDQPDDAGRKRFAQTALEYSRRAVALKPDDPVNVLSLAVCHGKLAVYSDTQAKIRYSRLVKEEAERALMLDPRYAWAHHVLGRWHYEVAALGSTSRFFVQVLYGGLPAASFGQSIQHLQRATELEPDELNHWLELGFAYAAAGRPAEARNSWQRGLAMPARGKHDEPAKQRARGALGTLR
jgi:tetratricopeptide (TPR) repeat protein